MLMCCLLNHPVHELLKHSAQKIYFFFHQNFLIFLCLFCNKLMNKHDTSEQKTSMIHPNLFGSSQKKKMRWRYLVVHHFCQPFKTYLAIHNKQNGNTSTQKRKLCSLNQFLDWKPVTVVVPVITWWALSELLPQGHRCMY